MTLEREFTPAPYEYTCAAAKRPSRTRALVLKGLRILFPALSVGLAVSVAWVSAVSLVGTPAKQAMATTSSLQLVEPRLVGEDEQGRTYLITAQTAQREMDQTRRISLILPRLIREEGKPTELRIKADRAVYDQATGKIDLKGNVHAAASSWNIQSSQATFDTRTGDVTTSGRTSSPGASVRVRFGR